MEILEVIKPKILSVRKIPYVNPFIAQQFDINQEDISLGLLSSDKEHSLIVALDEATKKSDAKIAYRSSFYGAVNPSNISGEILGIFSGPNPTVIDNALNAAVNYVNEKAYYYSIKSSNILFFPHVIGSIGRLLAQETGLPEGEAIAYLIGPPLETFIAFDYALKNSQTKLVKFFKPPTLTNMSGGYLTGSISDCQAAAEAFTNKIIEIANNPFDKIDWGREKWL